MHGGLGAGHARRLAKMRLHHRTAGHTDLLHIARAAPALQPRQLLQPGPALGQPVFGLVIAAVIHKLDELRPAHGLRVNFKFRHIHGMGPAFHIKHKAHGRRAQHPARGRDQQRLARL
jgi:hypothetical protein